MFVKDYGYPKEVKRVPADLDAALYLDRNKKLIFIKVCVCVCVISSPGSE